MNITFSVRLPIGHPIGRPIILPIRRRITVKLPGTVVGLDHRQDEPLSHG